jgi:hypothetical protein
MMHMPMAGEAYMLSSEVESIPGEKVVLAFPDSPRGEVLDIDDPDVEEGGNLEPLNEHAPGRELLDNGAFGLSTEDLSEREDELLALRPRCMRTAMRCFTRTSQQTVTLKKDHLVMRSTRMIPTFSEQLPRVKVSSVAEPHRISLIRSGEPVVWGMGSDRGLPVR